jgi:hypothetical protein
VEEEADESMYWLELLVHTGSAPVAAVQPLLRETGEILAMTLSSKKTLKARAGIRGFSRIVQPTGGGDESQIVNRKS